MRLPRHIPPTVWALGWVSLLTDIGSEMVHGLLPVLITGTLGASVIVLGLLEGAAEGLVLVVKVFSGYWSDALGRRKPLVLLGYGLAAAAKPLFPLATSMGAVAVARLADRLGKGIRGAPRDALISDVAPAAVRGASFGLRQSMDTAGAVLGPLAAVGLLTVLGGDVTLVLWIAVVPGMLAVMLVVFGVREPERQATPPVRLPITREGLASLGAPFWWVTAIGGALALARVSEAFLVLRASERGLAVAYLPMVLVVLSLTYAATAYPAGELSDRVPRIRVLLLGFAVLAVADATLALATDAYAVCVGAALWGVHLGLTQGVLASLVADTAPPQNRGTAFGVFNLVAGFGVLVAGASAGLLWELVAPAAPFVFGACAALLAMTATLRLKPRLGPPAGVR